MHTYCTLAVLARAAHTQRTHRALTCQMCRKSSAYKRRHGRLSSPDLSSYPRASCGRNKMIINVLHLVVTWVTVLSRFGSFVGRGLSRLSARRGSHVVSCHARGDSGVGCATRCAIRCAVYVTVVNVISFLGNESDRNVFASRR